MFSTAGKTPERLHWHRFGAFIIHLAFHSSTWYIFRDFFVNTEETSVITFYTFLDNIFEIFANRKYRKTIVFTHVQTFIYFFDVHA